MSIGTLARAVRKEKEWLVLALPDGREIRILTKDHVSGNNRLVGLVIKAPKDIKIITEDNENYGNIK